MQVWACTVASTDADDADDGDDDVGSHNRNHFVAVIVGVRPCVL